MVAHVEKQPLALRNKKGEYYVVYYYKKSIRHLSINGWLGKGLTKRQQGIQT